MNAAKLGLQNNLPMADRIIYATAIFHICIIWAEDADVENLQRVKYFPKNGIGQQDH